MTKPKILMEMEKIPGIETSVQDINSALNDIVNNSGVVLDGNYGIFVSGDYIGTDYLKRQQNILYATFYKKLRKLEAVKIKCRGDSITYGQDTVSGDIRVADPTVLPDGSTHTQTRASKTYPEALTEFLNSIYGAGKITTINEGYSGDTVKRGYTRWIANSQADIALINYAINDSALISLTDFITYYEKMIVREILWGSAVIILTPPKQRSADNNNVIIDVYANALHLLGQKYNIPVIVTDEFMSNYGTDIYCDGTHFNGTGYTIYGARLASLFVGEGCHKPKFVQSGSKLLTRPTIDNILYDTNVVPNATFADMSNMASPSEYTAGRGIIARLKANGYIIYSFYTESDDLLVLPSYYGWSTSVLKMDLDFNVMQPAYSLDTSVGLAIDMANKPTSTVQRTNAEGTQGKADFISGGNTCYLHIATKGWHTLKVSNSVQEIYLDGIEFIDYDTFQNLKDAYTLKNNPALNYYYGLTHASYSASPATVTQTRIKLSDFQKIFPNYNWSTQTTQYYKNTPFKITVCNFDQSILTYRFLIGDSSNAHKFLQATPDRVNIAGTPANERLVSSIDYDNTTSEIVINWGGVTNVLTEFAISVA